MSRSEARESGDVAGKLGDPEWAWAPYTPDARRPWSLAQVGHLFRRAAFGASWGELKEALAAGPQRSVERLLRPEADVARFNRTFDQFEAAGGDSGSTSTLRAWWLRRMIETPHPLLEKMTLFWHDHFATSNVRVKSSRLMARHLQLLRGHALGCFRSLLGAVVCDVAFLISLDAAANRKARPNDRFARRLIEEFTLGAGAAAGEDFKEVARAFTGWFVMRKELRYIPREHDSGTKRILGREGPFNREDVVRILLAQQAAPRFLVRNLYRWLISENGEPGDGLIAPLADAFSRDYDVAALVGTMLRSNLFFSPVAYRRRVKGPVEFALGIVRGLEGMVATSQLGADLAALGQDLYQPPTVKGWAGGRSWIQGATMLARTNLAGRLLEGAGAYGDKLDPLAVAERHGSSAPESAGRFLLDLFLQGDVPASVRELLLEGVARADGGRSRSLRQLAHAVVTLPEFQLA